MALYHLFHLATWAVGASAGGALAERFGIRAAMLAGACVCASAALLTWRLGLPRDFTGERAARPSLR
jgi:hypothetical protein